MSDEVEVNVMNVSPRDGKPGWKSTEFWIAVGMQCAGAFLLGKGQYELGTALMGASGLGYKVARTIQKNNEIKANGGPSG
jgi:hypothetical protein